MNLRFLFDRFSLALIATVAASSLWPAHGSAALWLDRFTTAGIALLFFLHGAHLPREAVVAGLRHWRLHALVLASTFVLFPLLGLALEPLSGALLTPELYLGVLFLCALPSTVQSSIAFTSIARGNIAAAVVAASVSNLAGVFLTPLLAALLLAAHGGMASPWRAVADIVLLLLAPFVLGHLLRPWIARWVLKRARLLAMSDRGTILMVVYGAFSHAVIEGLWRQVPGSRLLGLVALSCLLLGSCCSKVANTYELIPYPNHLTPRSGSFAVAGAAFAADEKMDEPTRAIVADVAARMAEVAGTQTEVA